MEVTPIKDVKKIKAIRNLLRVGEFGPRNELLFIMGINLAFRIGDLLNLTCGDVYEKGLVKKSILIKEQKTGKFRNTPLNKTIKELLKRYQDHLKNVEDSAPLFPSRKKGKAITRQQAHFIISSVGKTVGLSNIGTHSLRKTFGYFTFKNSGGNLALVQKLLNHSNSGDTLRYIGIDREEMDNAFLELNLG